MREADIWAPITTGPAPSSAVDLLDPETAWMLGYELGPDPVVGVPIQTAPAPTVQQPGLPPVQSSSSSGGSFGTIVAVGGIALAVGVAAYLWSK